VVASQPETENRLANHLVNLAQRSQWKLARKPVCIHKNGEIFLPFYRLKKGYEKAPIQLIEN